MSEGRTWRIWAGAAASLALFPLLPFALGPAPRQQVPGFLAAYGLSALGLVLLGVVLVRIRGAGREPWGWALGVALLCRLVLLAAPPSLSDDVYRYRWDGHLVCAGIDPYMHRPVDLVGRAEGLSAELLERLNSPLYYSVYPPLAQLTFALGTGLAGVFGGRGETWIRWLLLCAEAVAIWQLASLAGRIASASASEREDRGDQTPGLSILLLYALHPLAIWEAAAGVHSETLMLPWLLLALGTGLFVPRKGSGAFVLQKGAGLIEPKIGGRLFGPQTGARLGFYLAMAVAAKLTALLAAPIFLFFLWRRAGTRSAAMYLLALTITLALMFLPWLSPLGIEHIARSLALYSEHFSFNAPLYYGLHHLLGYREGVTDPLPYLGRALSLVAASWVLLLSILQSGDRRRLITTLAWAFTGYYLLSRVMHPWYFLPVVALAALGGQFRGRGRYWGGKTFPLSVLGFLLPLSYLRYRLGYESPWVMGAQVLPFLLSLGWAIVSRFTDDERSQIPSRPNLS